MPGVLNKDNFTIFYNNFTKKGEIVSVSKDTLKIHWNETETRIEYVEWKN